MPNADEYISLVENFCIELGIRRQMEAFRSMCHDIHLCCILYCVGNWLTMHSCSCEVCKIPGVHEGQEHLPIA